MKHYLLIGAGGTGTHLLRPLHMYLTSYHKHEDWLLHVIDGDVVEAKNLERQMFTPGAISMNKAQAAVTTLGDYQHVTPHPFYVSEENVASTIKDGDTVFICVDNFTVRKRIEDHCLTLDNVTVINGGNEKFDGSVQLWVRAQGENVTPRIGFLHPEVAVAVGDDRAAMTCQQAAALPGGEQTLIANLQSATWMLTALWRRDVEAHIHTTSSEPTHRTWTEVQYDALDGRVDHIDQRMARDWSTS